MITCAMESALNEYLSGFVECYCNYEEEGYDECRCEEIREEREYARAEMLADQEEEYWRDYDELH